MASKSKDFLMGQLVESVQGMEKRVNDIKTEMADGLKDIKTKLTKMNDGLEVKDQAYVKRFGRLEAWRNRFLGGMGVMIVVIPVIVAIIVFVMNRYR
jgi:t-SNARE complex subunit (syntaxin)